MLRIIEVEHIDQSVEKGEIGGILKIVVGCVFIPVFLYLLGRFDHIYYQEKVINIRCWTPNPMRRQNGCSNKLQTH
jgi:hypothetical protein